MKTETVPLNTIISEIHHLKSGLIKLLNKNKSYDQVLSFIISYFKDDEDDQPMPKIADISTELRIPYSSLKKQLMQLHDDIIKYASEGEAFDLFMKDSVRLVAGHIFLLSFGQNIF
jgi:hypothetical protein